MLKGLPVLETTTTLTPNMEAQNKAEVETLFPEPIMI
jgi:hypothetical protein